MTQRRDSSGRFKAKSDHKTRNRSIGGAALFGALAAGAAAAWRFGLFDRIRPKNAEHAAPDLALDAEHPDGNDRAPDAFRPDPTAAVPASEREGLRPPKAVARGFTEDRRTEELTAGN